MSGVYANARLKSNTTTNETPATGARRQNGTLTRLVSGRCYVCVALRAERRKGRTRPLTLTYYNQLVKHTLNRQWP